MRKNRRAAAGALLAAAAATTFSLFGTTVRAANLTFDADGAGPNTGGSGTWDTTTALWTPDAGANYQAWSNVTPDNAVFGGPFGTISLGEAITVGTVTYAEFSNGTVIDLNSFNLTQTGGSSFFVDPGPTPPDTSVTPSSITITNTHATRGTYTVTATPNSSGPRLSGNMNVTFNGTGTWTPVSVNDFTGNLTINGGGQLRTDGGNASLGSASGTIVLDGTNSLLNYSTPSGVFGTYTRDIQMLNNTVRLGTNGVKMITVTGSISGGDLNLVNNQGTLILAGANTYTGATNITVAANSGSSLVLAHNQALGASTSINIGSGDQGGVGLMANPTTGANISLGAGVTMNLGSTVPGSGLGMLHNYNGANTFTGSITLGSNTYRNISTDAGGTLLLSGSVGSNANAKGISKHGDGTLVLTGTNFLGQSNVTDGSNGTDIAQGTLRLDFSQSALNSDIINSGVGPGGTFSLTSNRSSQLVLSGGTLEVVGGGAGDTNVQNFSNRSAHGFTINPGESAIRAVQNDATSLTINVGRIMENSIAATGGGGTNPGGRHIGGTVDFTLPTTGNIVLGTAATGSMGVANAILTGNGAAFATVDGTEWAAMDATRNVVRGSSIAGFYTANTDTALAGNADMSGGVDTTLAADAPTTSLRFHNSGTRNIALGGFTLTTGGILVTNSGNGPTSINGGTLRAAAATLVLDRQDLVIIQKNTAAPLTVGAVIANNGTQATALTKAGAGTLDLTAANSYTGPTIVTGGVLKLSNATALGSGNLILKGGVIGLTEASGNWSKALGVNPGEFRWYNADGTSNIGTSATTNVISGGSGGFAAYGGTRTVNIGGAAATLRWHDTVTTDAAFNFLRSLSSLILGASDADGTVDFQNPIQLQGGNTFSYGERNIQVENGSADVDAIISGVISSAEAGIIKSGPGTLALTAVNTYGGATNINAGVLSVGASSGLGSSTNPLNFAGGTLKTTGGFSTGRIVTLKTGGGTIDTAGNNVSLTGTVSGVGGLTKTGAGTLTLANAGNNYTGATSASGGTLLLPNSLTTSSSVSASDSGTIELATDGSAMKVIKTGNVSVSGNGRIDLKDNKLITTTAAGTATAGVYDGLQGAVQSAYNFNAWDQPGLTTSMPDAVAGLTTIGIATGAQMRGLGPTDTDTFAGQTITGASTIAMYTYAGDANLDGVIDGGDYGTIDNFVQVPGADGYANGDFNYDGVIDGGDYGVIDNNIQAQGAGFPTSGSASASLSGVTAVPEPCGLAIVACAASLFGRRRRRHT